MSAATLPSAWKSDRLHTSSGRAEAARPSVSKRNFKCASSGVLGGGGVLLRFSASRSACIFSESQSSVFGGGAGSASTTGRVGVESADLEDLEDLGLREAYAVGIARGPRL